METAIRLKGIIFDLDGTLGNTLPICFTAFRHAFERFTGRDYSEREISTFFGPSEEGIIERVVPNQSTACLLAYLGEYERSHANLREPFPGIRDALNLLRQRGMALAVVTGKGERSAAISLQYLGLADYFDWVVTGSSQGAIKPLAIEKVLTNWKLLPEQVAYVGDSAYDMEAAIDVGVIPLLAAWAETSNYQDFSETDPLATFSTLESFIDWIDRYVGSD